MQRIGIIGGSGLYEMDGFNGLEEIRVETPFGDPSDSIICGDLDGLPVAFVPRHGRGHRFNPSEINYRANIWALKSLGVDFVLSVSATGSMRHEIEPGHLVFPDQFIDRTRGKRKDTFFDDGIVGHVGFADPTSKVVTSILTEEAIAGGIAHHSGGTYVCIEGPQFSTRAESRLYRSWDGVAVIGMTNLTEAKLAREAELHYATIAMATDYDVWHESEEDVTVEQVLATMAANVQHAKALIRRAVPRVAALRGTPAATLEVLRFAVMTAPEHLTPEIKDRVGLLMNKYWNQN
ncbi:MAG: 5'-methylthioadenosine phosphorylase [Myxococcota bacterium]|jgi:5'-methylthioadenosine phosphorylase